MNMERIELEPGYSVSRLVKGGWHLAGGHGAIDRDQAVSDMASFVENGITTFDCADHYTGVEELIGEFRARYPSLAKEVQVHTKFVPDLDDLPRLDRAYVVNIIDRSLRRLRLERLDLVQFFWWDFKVPGAIETALALDDLRREGKIARLGVTNFNTAQFSSLVDAGIPFVAHQLQYSLVDRRPDWRMSDYCRARGVTFLTYGQLLGGFLSEEWLGEEEPQGPLGNRSLTKYKLIIDEFGGWRRFQELLTALGRVASRHGVGIGEIALRWTLDRPNVAACIVGATSTRHLARNLKVMDFKLSREDLAELALVTDGRQGPNGDCYELENDRAGPHGRIMRYNQNKIDPAAPR
jgi:aryl-alcohol dehydrogenase-like predicted oxidoreductase